MKQKVMGIIAMPFLIACAINAFAAGDNFTYSTDTSTLKTNYMIDASQSSFANLVVLPYGMDRTDLNENNADPSCTLFKLCYTVGGIINEQVQLGEGFKSGAYILYTECGTETYRDAFIVPTADLQDIVSDVNGGSNLTNARFGADNEIFAKYETDISRLINNARSGGKYTEQSFLDAYMASEGIARFRGSDLTLDDLEDLYGSYFSGAFAEYDGWSDAKKQKLSNILKQHSLAKLSAPELVKDAIFVSGCQMAGNVYDLQAMAVDHFNKSGLDIKIYEQLNTYDKYSVFAELFENIKTLGTADKIYEKFLSVSKDIGSDTKPEYKSTGGGGGGGPAFPTKSATALPAQGQTDTEVAADMEAEVFADISVHWAKEYIIECHNNELVNGYDDNTFRPDNTLTRAELTALLTNLLKLEAVEFPEFSDVSTSSWYYDSISKAYAAKIITGYGEIFKPESDVSRQDMAVMILRCFDYLNLELAGEKIFEDSGLVAEYAKHSVAALGANGIITGDNNIYRPNDSLTRAEAAAIICRVNDYITGGVL